MTKVPNLESSMKAGNPPGLAAQSKCANKSNGIRGAILAAAVVTLICPPPYGSMINWTAKKAAWR